MKGSCDSCYLSDTNFGACPAHITGPWLREIAGSWLRRTEETWWGQGLLKGQAHLYFLVGNSHQPCPLLSKLHAQWMTCSYECTIVTEWFSLFTETKSCKIFFIYLDELITHTHTQSSYSSSRTFLKHGLHFSKSWLGLSCSFLLFPLHLLSNSYLPSKGLA